jgi:hypothetical protein
MYDIVREQKGTITVLIALSLTAIIGLGAVAVDIGNLYLNKARLSNMADAAVLAGVQELPANPATAGMVAIQYARMNGKETDTIQNPIVSNSTTLSITIRRNVTYYFAQIFSLVSKDISAAASAQVIPVNSAAGIVPFGVVKQPFVYGQTYQLKAGGGGGYDGNYGGLALGGKGANVYRDNIKYGYNGLIKVGDWLTTEPGNMSGPTSDGVDYRIGLDPAATFSTVQKGSPRIVIVPLINDLDVNGRSEVQVAAFAAFFLEGVEGSGNKNYVYGKFLQMVLPAASYADTTADSSCDYGLYGVKLIL